MRTGDPEPVEPGKTFATQEEARRTARELNREPPEWGYSRWFTTSGNTVVRTRMFVAEDLQMSAGTYERALADRVSESGGRDFYGGVEIESVKLQGAYPDTKLAVIFRASNEGPGRPDPDSRFGVRTSVWPASDDDPEHEAAHWQIFFLEFLSTGWPRTDKAPDSDGIVWLS